MTWTVLAAAAVATAASVLAAELLGHWLAARQGEPRCGTDSAPASPQASHRALRRWLARFRPVR